MLLLLLLLLFPAFSRFLEKEKKEEETGVHPFHYVVLPKIIAKYSKNPKISKVHSQTYSGNTFKFINKRAFWV